VTFPQLDFVSATDSLQCKQFILSVEILEQCAVVLRSWQYIPSKSSFVYSRTFWQLVCVIFYVLAHSHKLMIWLTFDCRIFSVTRIKIFFWAQWIFIATGFHHNEKWLCVLYTSILSTNYYVYFVPAKYNLNLMFWNPVYLFLPRMFSLNLKYIKVFTL
jgi:hypothetical protein